MSAQRVPLPVIAIATGDPAGVGPEICVKALASGEPSRMGRIVLFGSIDVLQRANTACGTRVPFQRILSIDEVARVPEQSVPVVDSGSFSLAGFEPGRPSAEGGAASFEWLAEACNAGSGGAAQAVIVAPMDTTSIKLAGISRDCPEFEPPNTYQLRLNGRLRVVPITEHLPMREIVSHVTRANVEKVVVLLANQLERWGISQPAIAVAGLNPHAMFDEEREEIAPAIVACRSRGIDATGPVTPDAVFRMALDGRFDAIVTMYHDQGQIAVKTVAFEGACTVFLGLNYVRTGIPHGTAMDIAGTGQAQHLSMLAAIRTATSLCRGAAQGLELPIINSAQVSD